jgi:hypothetical protein
MTSGFWPRRSAAFPIISGVAIEARDSRIEAIGKNSFCAWTAVPNYANIRNYSNTQNIKR